MKLPQTRRPTKGAASLPVRGAWIEMCIGWWLVAVRLVSLPVRGAWIEIVAVSRRRGACACRSPCGERGLKSFLALIAQCDTRRSPCGERGLKSLAIVCRLKRIGRSPCGERGLKCLITRFANTSASSLPVRGAWIEITRMIAPPFSVWRRSPCGERGLKLAECPWRNAQRIRRSPCGERGLKYCVRRIPDALYRRSPCGERGLK